MNPEPIGIENGVWMPTLVFDHETGVTREKLQVAFAAVNIDARVFFRPLSSLPMFEPVVSNIGVYALPNRAINTPSYHDLTRAEQDIVMVTLSAVTKVVGL